MKPEEEKVKAIEPFKGPSVMWIKADVRRFIDHFGFEGAVKEIAGKWFQEEYVRKSLSELMWGTEKDTLYTSTLSGEGIV